MYPVVTSAVVATQPRGAQISFGAIDCFVTLANIPI